MGTIISLFLSVITVKLFKKSKPPERKTLDNLTSGENGMQTESLNNMQYLDNVDYLCPEQRTVDEADDEYEQISEYFENHLSTFSETLDDYEIPVARNSPISFSFCHESIDVPPNNEAMIEQTTEYLNLNSSAEIKKNHLNLSSIKHHSECLCAYNDICEKNIQQCSSEHNDENLNPCQEHLKNYLTPLAVICSSHDLNLCKDVSDDYLTPQSLKCTTESEFSTINLSPLPDNNFTECENQSIEICEDYLTPLSVDH